MDDKVQTSGQHLIPHNKHVTLNPRRNHMYLWQLLSHMFVGQEPNPHNVFCILVVLINFFDTVVTVDLRFGVTRNSSQLPHADGCVVAS